MKGRITSCPSCGAPVEFRNRGSWVAVCDFCQTAVGRGDKSPEDYGKVGDLVVTDSPFRRGTVGQYRNRSFEVTGRVQYQHPAGGTWDEWYLTFRDGKMGWLAEAQGKRYLTFRRQLKPQENLDLDKLEPGQHFRIRNQEFSVDEVGSAVALAAQGEIPWVFRPGADHRFADLSGSDGAYATIDADETGVSFYLGREVSLDDLQLESDDWQAERSPQLVPGVQLNCPHCGGQISLHAPDKTERVTCGNCSSLLDVSQGKLSFFKTVTAKKVHPKIPLGSEGTIDGVGYTVIGFMERFTTYHEKTYPWVEYLLYSTDKGFRWLVQSERHWTFVEPVATHDVKFQNRAASVNKHRFKMYDRGHAIVRFVLGEFYWRVEIGEAVETVDYISPPHSLSAERSKTSSSEELNVSFGTYMSPAEVEAAFGLESGHLPIPWGVGPCQPSPEVGYGVFLLWPVFIGLLWVTHLAFRQSDSFMMLFAMAAVSLFPIGVLFYKHNFEVQRWQDSDYSPYSSDDD